MRPSTLFQSSRRGLWVVLLVISFSGCGFGKKKSESGSACSPGGGAPAAVTAAFKATLYPVFQANACKNCHTAGGTNAPYSFSDPDPAKAVDDAEKVTSFGSPDQSRIVLKVQGGHNCSNCGQLAADFTTQIKAWAAATGATDGSPVSTCTDAIKVKLASRAINISALTTTTDRQIIWDVSATNPQIPPGVYFSVSVRLFTAPQPGVDNGSLKFSKPSLGLGSSITTNMKIANIHFTQDDNDMTEALNFIGTSFVVQPRVYNPAKGWPYPSNSSFWQVIQLPAPGQGSFGFTFTLETATGSESTLGKVNAPACKAQAQFDQVYNNVFNFNTTCTQCHASAGSDAYNRFPMVGGSTAICPLALQRANPASPMDSLIIQNPTGHNGHDDIKLSQSEINTIITWLNAENAAQ